MEHPPENRIFTPRSILDNRRNVTDFKMLIFFIICLLIWIPAVIYGFVAGDAKDFFQTNENYNLRIEAYMIYIAIGYSFLCAFLSILFYVILRWIPNISYVTFVAIWIQVIAAILALNQAINFSQVTTLIGSILGLIVIHVIISAEWFYLPEGLIKESCKAIRAVPTTVVFSAVFYFISLLVLAIIVSAYVYLMSIEGVLPKILIIADLFIGTWIYMMTLGICAMSLFATYSTWYWTENKNEVSFGTVLRSFKIIIRYHIGTLAYGTSIFGIIRTVWTLIVHAISYAQEHGTSLNFGTYILYNIFDMIAFRFTTFGGLARCATHGTDYYQSTTSAVSYCETRPKRCLLSLKVMDYVLVFVLTVIAVIMLIAVSGVMISSTDHEKALFLILVLLGSSLFLWTILVTFCIGYYSILLCFFEDLEVNDDSETRPYLMSQKLRLALNHDGPPPCIRNCLPHIIDKEE